VASLVSGRRGADLASGSR